MKTWKAALPALALVAPLLLSGSPVAGASAGPAAKTAVVAYGDGPVFQDAWDQPVQLTFEAVEGDLVSVASAADHDCETIKLTGPGQDNRKSGSEFHAITQTGTYTFEYDQVCDDPLHPQAPGAPVGVQLLKARIVPVRLGERTVRLAADQGYVDVAEVVVRERDEPLVLEANGGPDHRLTWTWVYEASDVLGRTSGNEPLGAYPGWIGPDVVLQPGGYEPNLLSGPVEAGEPLYFYTVGVARRVRLVPLQVERVEVDGAGTRMELGDTRRIRFRGEAGEWIRVAGGALPQDLHLGLGRVPSAAYQWPTLPTHIGRGTQAVWRLPATGRYSLDVMHAASEVSKPSYSLRIRTVPTYRHRVLTFEEPLRTTLRPGRWALHRVRSSSEGPSGYLSSLEVTNAKSRGWLAVLLGGTQSSGDSGYDYGCVTDEGGASVDVAFADWLLVVPGRSRGSLDLALNPPYADGLRETCPGSRS